ncbi:hypothetical protein J2T17_006312 [Paenibacillus mucilaginosus]|uniref:DUF6843 domain-containing protein n=1 Tax=Paenibacillus mucilaginosus TaxID=61624 RepID=UPI003D193738
MKKLNNLPLSVYIGLIILILAAIFMVATTSKYPLHIYLLPDNFTGEVVINFEQADSPPVEMEGKTIIYRIPSSGKLNTSSKLSTGPIEAYHVDENGARKKVRDEEFHAGGTTGGGEDNFPRAYLFIGSQEQYENYLKRQ